MIQGKNAKLVLEDGSIFYGYSFGSSKSNSGEVVFATGMTGYPESLTDPSYAGQILCLTYPLIGNYGVPSDKKDEHGLPLFFESNKIHVRGLIVSDYSFKYSHWNAKKSLAEWLQEENVPALYGIDTRELTKKLRKQGAMLGKIIIDEQSVEQFDPNKIDIVKEVTVAGPVTYSSNNTSTEKTRNAKTKTKNNELSNVKNNIEYKYKKSNRNLKIVLIDCGLKNNIIRCLLKRNVEVIRVPYDYDFFHLDFDGILISNGPGDPKQCKKTISLIKKAIKEEIPTMGICLGNQILALAAGANTYKLKYGHRAQNQPCVKEGTKRCFITTQNHGFAVDPKSLPSGWKVLFTNINDNTNEGIKHKTKPFFSAQFHPEATPGPVDTEFIFDEFLEMVHENKK